MFPTLKHVSIPVGVATNPESHLSESLSKAAQTKREALAILMDFDRGIMNGLATYTEMPDHENLLVAEYARNRWILTLNDPVFGKFQVPGCETSDGNILVFFSNAAIREVPELNAFFHPEKAPSFLLGESYVSTILPGDANDPIRREFATIVVSNFARTASSPLKQDIVPALAEAGWIRISENSPDSASAPEFPTVVRPASRSDRMKSRKYRIVKKESSPANERHLRKHLSHYANFFAVDGEKPSSVHLTVSGKSANTAVIRFVSSRIADHSKIDVHPGYFFLNEPDFPLEVPSSGAVDPQALFFSIDAGYAGMGGKNRYFSEVSEKIDSIIVRAGKNPETPYFVCVDATSDLSGISDRLADLIERRASLPNLTVFISSSLTKYNRSERNYHFGIIAKYSSAHESFESIFRYAFDLERAVSTSYGDLSPRGILHFPRLRLSAVERQRENGEANRKAFMDGFFGAYENFSGTSFRFEHYPAYSYLILDLPADARNSTVSDFLETAVPSELRGSSFYHNEIRFCDVPDVACSRFAPAPGGYENSVRIAWPDSLEEAEMAELGKNLGQWLRDILDSQKTK